MISDAIETAKKSYSLYVTMPIKVHVINPK